MRLLKKIKYLLVTLYFYIIATLYIVFYGGFVLLSAWFMRKFLKREKEAREYVLREIRTFGKRSFSWLFSKVVIHGEENLPDKKPFL
ncbi:MAG: 1-acyl-sn-glycerol-3-phosphate acyltransferase, partial [Thermotogae bacterium]